MCEVRGKAVKQLTDKVLACVPDETRREFQVSVRDEYWDGIRLSMARCDGRVVWSCLMTSASVAQMSKKTLKMVVQNYCDQMAAAMEAWALENPDGSVQTENPSPDDGR